MKRIWILSLVFAFLLAGTLILMPKEGKTMKIDVKGGTIHGKLIDCSKDEVVLIIAGSGQTDMNGNSGAIEGRNDSFLLLADALRKEGISSFRYDKRSAGKSAGTFNQNDQVYFEDFLDDLNACIGALKDRGFEKIILAGHSQGSLLAFMAADNADAIISIAGTAFPIGETMIKQYASQLGEDAPIIETLNKLMKCEIDEKIAEENPIYSIANQKFLMSWMKYDPAEILGKIEKPVLILQGESDLQVYREDFNSLCDASPDAESTLIPGMNHVLKDVDNVDDNVKAYADPSFALSEGLVTAISEFVNK